MSLSKSKPPIDRSLTGQALQLGRIWEEQKHYNERIQALRPDMDSRERWTEILLLGMVTEIDEVLREVQWKRHRRLPAGDPYMGNLAYELADLTKYVMSLWQTWGFTLEEAIQHTACKNDLMSFRLDQEFMPLPPKEVDVLVTDIDGTLANFSIGFWEWATKLGLRYRRPTGKTLHLDLDMGIDYRQLQRLKHEFIASKGFSELPAHGPAVRAVRTAAKAGARVIVCTARPAKQYPHIWEDTWNWLATNDVPTSQLHMGAEVRIELLLKLADNGNRVVLFDDNPELVERSLNCGIPVVLPKYEYNHHLWDRENVTPVDVTAGPITFPFAKREAVV